MRYLVKFTKESNIKFISHLDLMRTLQKIIKRANLPIEYSKGFNPHMNISLAQPLSVGMFSKGEYMDINLSEDLEPMYIKEKLDENSPSGVKFINVVKLNKERENGKKIPQSMAAVDGATYAIGIKYDNTEHLEEEIKKIFDMQEWKVIKKGKSGEKEIDIKPMLKKIQYKIGEDVLSMNVLVSCGSRENLSADILSKFILENTSNGNKDAFVLIEREEMYGRLDNELFPLDECLGKM
ncbi:TIGR03936 family radical SAM-associated protein [uncultured Clostridium sp.]|uniref:TIGR03936 family radical SAM-associated protein n=1 Tax=uncultured Clostridium sp. TaxID=59620 RepID=UPI0028F0A922|nr:TIGR03936 family radical SAM-associated protein [uncultured Clostridium sp.]